jgi:hypothetical protein
LKELAVFAFYLMVNFIHQNFYGKASEKSFSSFLSFAYALESFAGVFSPKNMPIRQKRAKEKAFSLIGFTMEIYSS